MPVILGPRAKRVDILAYKGLTWGTSFKLDIDDAPVDLTTGALTADFRKSYDTAIIASFVWEVVDDFEQNVYLLGSDTSGVAIGNSEDDPACKFVYDIIWTPTGSTGIVVIYGVLTIAPVSTDV